MILMAKKNWDALPEAARKILAVNTGEADSRRFGAFSDGASNGGRGMTQAMGDKQKIVTATAEQSAALKQKLAPMTAAWAKATPGGDKVLAASQADLATASSGK